MYVQKGENTIGILRHIPTCFGLYHTRSDRNNKYNDFSGSECDDEFVRDLEREAKEIFDEFWEERLDTNLTEEEQLMLPDEEIIKNEKIKFEFRYRLNYKFMPMKEYNIGKREKKLPQSVISVVWNLMEKAKRSLTMTMFRVSISG